MFFSRVRLMRTGYFNSHRKEHSRSALSCEQLICSTTSWFHPYPVSAARKTRIIVIGYVGLTVIVPPLIGQQKFPDWHPKRWPSGGDIRFCGPLGTKKLTIDNERSGNFPNIGVSSYAFFPASSLLLIKDMWAKGGLHRVPIRIPWNHHF